MKGILLAGGSGTRLYPVTQVVSKQLLPLYDKPMIYYPLSTLMLAGLRDILVVTTPEDAEQYQRLLGGGEQFGINLHYVVQPQPQGIAQAFLLRPAFQEGTEVCVVLGDNVFHGHGLTESLRCAATLKEGALIYGHWVRDPERYGVVEYGADGRPLSIEEKPARPKSNYAVVGIYFYDRQVTEVARSLAPSARGELEITAVNNAYLQAGTLRAEKFGRGTAWLDTGTHAALLEAGNFIATLENRQGLKIACLEEIGYQLGYIDAEAVLRQARRYDKTDYGRYLKELIEAAP